MSTGPTMLERVEEHLGIAPISHPHRHILEGFMQFLAELVAAQDKLIADRQAATTEAAAEKARADAAEAEVATLKAQIAADEATVEAELAKVNAEISAETGASTVPGADSISGAEGNDLVHADPTLAQ